jgi:ribonuclease D
MLSVSALSPEEIGQLQVEKFPGRIEVIDRLSQVGKSVRALRGEEVVGFDTETRPNFRKGESNMISLLQLSTADTCYLFRLNLIGIPQEVEGLLSDTGVKKVGLSLGDDFRALRQRTSVSFGNFTDLQELVKASGGIAGSTGGQEIGLRKLYAVVFGKKISKGQQLTNWDASQLTAAQQGYAALDAWACLQLYKAMSSRSSNDLANPC